MERQSIFRSVRGPTAASMLAVSVFICERLFDFGAISLLYLVVLLTGTAGRGKLAVCICTLLCLALATASAFPNFPQVSSASFSELLFASAAIFLMGLFLIARLDLQKTRKALSESEANQRNFADSVPQLLWRATSDGKLDYLNRRFTEITGHDRDDAIRDQSWMDAIHPDDRESFNVTWEEARRSADVIRSLFRVREKSGSYRWMLSEGRALPDPNDASDRRWYGGLSDIDAEIRAREEIRNLADGLEERVRERTAELVRSEGKYRTLFQDMNIAYAEQDVSRAKVMLDEIKAAGVTDFKAYAEANPDFIDRCLASISVISVNDALLSMMGYEDHAELVAKPPTANAEDSRRIMSMQLEAIFEGRRHFTSTTVLIGKDNRRVPVAVGVNVLSDWSISLSTQVDISEQQQAHEMMLAAREDLARANRAATIGALSTSLAHELNQPLLAIVVDAQTSKRWLKKDPPRIADALAAIERVSENANRTTSVIRRTREKLVRGRRQVGKFDLDGLARETARLLDRDMSQRQATLRIISPPEETPALADRIEIQQVLINLIVNAAEAMTGSAEERLVEVEIARLEPGTATISVSDSGPGISPEHLPMLFEPFFSTKPGGMGMGLQICRSIIEGAGGEILAANGRLGGAVFTIKLPAIEPSVLETQCTGTPTTGD